MIARTVTPGDSTGGIAKTGKRLRELTPPRLCAWLVAVARQCDAPASMPAARFELTAAQESGR